MDHFNVQTFIQWVLSGLVSAAVMILTLRFAVNRLEEKLNEALSSIKELKKELKDDFKDLQCDFEGLKSSHIEAGQKMALLEYRTKLLEKKFDPTKHSEE